MQVQSGQSLGIPLQPHAAAGKTAHERLNAFVGDSTVFALVKGTPMQPQCGFSDRVMRIMNTLGVPYATFNILADPEIRAGAKTWDVNGGWHTFPQVYVNGEFMGGCDIVSQMYEQGDLQKVVAEAMESAGPGKLHSGESELPVAGGAPSASSFDVPESAKSTGDGSDDVQELSPRKVDLLGREHFVMIDVREGNEFAMTKIEGSQLLAMSEIGMRWDSLPQDANVLLVCRSGARSRRVAEFLVAKGYRHIYNLTGGINAWSEIDDSVTPY